MANLSIKTMMAALLAGSIAATAGTVAYARDGETFDPAKFQQRIEKRVDKALTKIDATAEQKKKITDILKAAFTDAKVLRDKRIRNREVLKSAMQEQSIDPAKIEAIRVEQMKVADEVSKRFTKALIEAANVLTVEQRQAFFKNWGDRHGWWRG